jgi:hypothetical protein
MVAHINCFHVLHFALDIQCHKSLISSTLSLLNRLLFNSTAFSIARMGEKKEKIKEGRNVSQINCFSALSLSLSLFLSLSLSLFLFLSLFSASTRLEDRIGQRGQIQN